MIEHYLKAQIRQLITKRPELFDVLIEALTDGFWVQDLSRPSEEYYSPNLVRLMGYRPDEVPFKQHWWQSKIGPEHVQDATDLAESHLADPSVPYSLPVRYQHKDGSDVWVQCRGTAIRDKEGKPLLFVGVHHDLTSIKTAERRFEALSIRDALTGLLNRRGLELELKRLQALVQRESSGLFAAFIDLDDFKDVNTEHGHDVGDAVLKEMAIRIQGSLRIHDEIGRFGGDEFIALLLARDKDAARGVLERVLHGLDRPHHVTKEPIQCTATAALVEIEGKVTLQSLIERAGPLLLRAKLHRKSTVATESRRPAAG